MTTPPTATTEPARTGELPRTPEGVRIPDIEAPRLDPVADYLLGGSVNSAIDRTFAADQDMLDREVRRFRSSAPAGCPSSPARRQPLTRVGGAFAGQRVSTVVPQAYCAPVWLLVTDPSARKV
jgi:hypothetical protein